MQRNEIFTSKLFILIGELLFDVIVNLLQFFIRDTVFFVFQLKSKLIDKNSASDIEIMRRYLSLVETYKKLDKSIEKNGVMISVKNGKQTFLKANPAVSEKVKVNAALIKLGEFFEKKRSEKTAEKGINLNELY